MQAKKKSSKRLSITFDLRTYNQIQKVKHTLHNKYSFAYIVRLLVQREIKGQENNPKPVLSQEQYNKLIPLICKLNEKVGRLVEQYNNGFVNLNNLSHVMNLLKKYHDIINMPPGAINLVINTIHESHGVKMSKADMDDIREKMNAIWQLLS